MDLLIELDRWSHECCGAAIERGDKVSLTCVPVNDRSSGAQLLCTNHAYCYPIFICTGSVLDLALFDRQTEQQQPIQRVPSGQALCGFDDADDGLIYPMSGDGPLLFDGSPRFQVLLGSVVAGEVDPTPWLRSVQHEPAEQQPGA